MPEKYCKNLSLVTAYITGLIIHDWPCETVRGLLNTDMKYREYIHVVSCTTETFAGETRCRCEKVALVMLVLYVFDWWKCCVNINISVSVLVNMLKMRNKFICERICCCHVKWLTWYSGLLVAVPFSSHPPWCGQKPLLYRWCPKSMSLNWIYLFRLSACSNMCITILNKAMYSICGRNS